MAASQHWIPHSASQLGREETKAAREVIEDNFVGSGPQAAELEKEFCRRTGRKHAFAVSSGYNALSLAVRSLDLPPLSLIALPTLTCSSVFAAVRGAGHRVWLTDIQDDDLTIDLASLPNEAAAIVAPHAYGAPVDVEKLMKSGRPWIEDCATSPSALVNDQPAGSFGTFAVFSFGSTKYLTGGSGGMLVTDDSSLAARVSDLLEFDRFEKNGDWRHGIPPALPGRLSDLNASVALVQWRRLAEFTQHRKQIAGIYDNGLKKILSLKLPRLSEGHGFYRYIVYTQCEAASLAKELREHGVDARHSVNAWLHHAAQTDQAIAGGPWPVAERWREHLLSLPIHPLMKTEDAHRVVDLMSSLLQ